MINFRFHIVSLIAIFLALALGVVIGAGVIDRGVVDTLDNRLDTRRGEVRPHQARERRAQRPRTASMSDMIGDLQPFAVSGRLAGDDVGVVAVRGVDGDRVSALVTAAQQADATATGTLWLEDKWALADDDSVKALQDALGTTTKNKATLRAEGLAAARAAARVARPRGRGRGGPARGPPGRRVPRLRRGGGRDHRASSPDAVRASCSWWATADRSTPTLVAVPAAKALHAAEVPLVVASVWVEVTDGPDRADAVQPIRDSELATTVSTVDDLDLAEGPTTVVLALADLFVLPPADPWWATTATGPTRHPCRLRRPPP